MRTPQALQAEADAEEALATLPLSLAPAGHLWLGRARLAQGNWQEAASAFKAALRAIGAARLRACTSQSREDVVGRMPD